MPNYTKKLTVTDAAEKLFVVRSNVSDVKIQNLDNGVYQRTYKDKYGIHVEQAILAQEQASSNRKKIDENLSEAASKAAIYDQKIKTLESAQANSMAAQNAYNQTVEEYDEAKKEVDQRAEAKSNAEARLAALRASGAPPDEIKIAERDVATAESQYKDASKKMDEEDKKTESAKQKMNEAEAETKKAQEAANKANPGFTSTDVSIAKRTSGKFVIFSWFK